MMRPTAIRGQRIHDSNSPVPRMADTERWMLHSACSQVDPNLWYADSPLDQFEAVQICSRCEVRPECLYYALRHGEKFGIWGGYTTAEREQMLKRRVS
jgi:WhiB family transcriptional regulator, redox-sensing transcriptional regulator